MFWQSGAFAKTKDCVDLLSFDPGIVNCGVVHLRVDKQRKRFCVLHAALLNIKAPYQSLRRESVAESAQKSRSNPRKKKPDHVEPYAATWPRITFDTLRTAQHDKKLADFAALCDVKFEHEMALLPFALCATQWLDGSDPDLDAVLVEVQDPQNPKMRALGHSVQTFYEGVNARKRDAQPSQLRVQYVSSRLKLSDAVLGVLASELRFSEDQAVAPLSESLASVVSRRSHAAKKSSAVQVFKAFDEAAPAEHSFFVWARAQRNTKHNIFDALLQALSWMMQEAIGFDAGVLNGRRRELQKHRAQQKRKEKAQLGAIATPSAPPARNTGDSFAACDIHSNSAVPATQQPLKRRRIRSLAVNVD